MNKQNNLTFNTSTLFTIFEKIKVSGGRLFSFLKTFNQRQSLRRPELLRILKIIRAALSRQQPFVLNRKRAFIQKLGCAVFALFLTIGSISPSLGMNWFCCGGCEDEDAPHQPAYQSLPSTGGGNIQYDTSLGQSLNPSQVSGGYGATSSQNLQRGFGDQKTQPQDSSQLLKQLPTDHKDNDTVYIPVKHYNLPVVRNLSGIFNDEQGDNADLFLLPKPLSTNHRANKNRQDMPYIYLPNGQEVVLDGKESVLDDSRAIVGITIHFREKSISRKAAAPRKTSTHRKRSTSTLSPLTPEHSRHKSKIKERKLDLSNDNDGPPSPYKAPASHSKTGLATQKPQKILEQGSSNVPPQKKRVRSPSDVGVSPCKGKTGSLTGLSEYQELLRGDRNRIGNMAWETLSSSNENLAARLFWAIKGTKNRQVEFDDIVENSSKPFFTLYLDHEVSATRYYYDEVNITTRLQSPFKGKKEPK